MHVTTESPVIPEGENNSTPSENSTPTSRDSLTAMSDITTQLGTGFQIKKYCNMSIILSFGVSCGILVIMVLTVTFSILLPLYIFQRENKHDHINLQEGYQSIDRFVSSIHHNLDDIDAHLTVHCPLTNDRNISSISDSSMKSLGKLLILISLLTESAVIVGFGTEDGYFLAGSSSYPGINGSVVLLRNDLDEYDFENGKQGTIYSYTVDENGDFGSPVFYMDKFDPRYDERIIWYTTLKNEVGLYSSTIQLHPFLGTTHTHSKKIFDGKGNFIGGILIQFQARTLNHLKFVGGDTVFFVDVDTGLLLGGSEDDGERLVSASNSSNEVIRKNSQYLLDKFQTWDNVHIGEVAIYPTYTLQTKVYQKYGHNTLIIHIKRSGVVNALVIMIAYAILYVIVSCVLSFTMIRSIILATNEIKKVRIIMETILTLEVDDDTTIVGIYSNIIEIKRLQKSLGRALNKIREMKPYLHSLLRTNSLEALYNNGSTELKDLERSEEDLTNKDKINDEILGPIAHKEELVIPNIKSSIDHIKKVKKRRGDSYRTSSNTTNSVGNNSKKNTVIEIREQQRMDSSSSGDEKGVSIDQLGEYSDDYGPITPTLEEYRWAQKTSKMQRTTHEEYKRAQKTSYFLDPLKKVVLPPISRNSHSFSGDNTKKKRTRRNSEERESSSKERRRRRRERENREIAKLGNPFKKSFEERRKDYRREEKRKRQQKRDGALELNDTRLNLTQEAFYQERVRSGLKPPNIRELSNDFMDDLDRCFFPMELDDFERNKQLNESSSSSFEVEYSSISKKEPLEYETQHEREEAIRKRELERLRREEADPNVCKPIILDNVSQCSFSSSSSSEEVEKTVRKMRVSKNRKLNVYIRKGKGGGFIHIEIYNFHRLLHKYSKDFPAIFNTIVEQCMGFGKHGCLIHLSDGVLTFYYHDPNYAFREGWKMYNYLLKNTDVHKLLDEKYKKEKGINYITPHLTPEQLKKMNLNFRVFLHKANRDCTRGIVGCKLMKMRYVFCQTFHDLVHDRRWTIPGLYPPNSCICTNKLFEIIPRSYSENDFVKLRVVSSYPLDCFISSKVTKNSSVETLYVLTKNRTEPLRYKIGKKMLLNYRVFPYFVASSCVKEVLTGKMKKAIAKLEHVKFIPYAIRFLNFCRLLRFHGIKMKKIYENMVSTELHQRSISILDFNDWKKLGSSEDGYPAQYLVKEEVTEETMKNTISKLEMIQREKRKELESLLKKDRRKVDVEAFRNTLVRMRDIQWQLKRANKPTTMDMSIFDGLEGSDEQQLEYVSKLMGDYSFPEEEYQRELAKMRKIWKKEDEEKEMLRRKKKVEKEDKSNNEEIDTTH